MEHAYHILSKTFDHYSMTLKPFSYDRTNNTISFTGDAYFDPVLVILGMRKHGVLKARTEYAGSEIDRVVITEVNLPLLQQVMENKPDWKNLDSIMSKLNIPKEEDKPLKDDEFITLHEGVATSNTKVDISLYFYI
jgi:hypothetical protein